MNKNDKFLYSNTDKLGLVIDKEEYQEIINGTWKNKINYKVVWFDTDNKVFDFTNIDDFPNEEAEKLEFNSIVLNDEQYNDYLDELNSDQFLVIK